MECDIHVEVKKEESIKIEYEEYVEEVEQIEYEDVKGDMKIECENYVEGVKQEEYVEEIKQEDELIIEDEYDENYDDSMEDHTYSKKSGPRCRSADSQIKEETSEEHTKGKDKNY